MNREPELMVMNEDARIAELMQKMRRKKLYILLSKPLVAPEKLTSILPAHLEYMIGLEKRDLVFASGPLSEPGAAPAGYGLTVLRAKDVVEARAIA